MTAAASTIHVNGIPYRWPLRPVVVVCIDGGDPAYLQRFDSKKSLRENLLAEVLRPEGYLFDEVHYLLHTELTNPSTYNSILAAVARGAERVGDVALSVGVDSPTANKYLHVLRELRLVAREVLFTSFGSAGLVLFERAHGRDETPIEGFEQDGYIENAPSNSRTIADLLDEFRLLRTANMFMLNHLNDEAWLRMGTASGLPVSVRALAYIMAGHITHHIHILKERYLVK